MRTRVLGAAAAAAIVLFGAAHAYRLAEYPRVMYASYADAIRDGFDRRGWLPFWVPRSARHLEEVHDLDSNRQWLRFSLLPADTAEIFARSVPISIQTARQTGVGAPRMTDWPMELDRMLLATPRSTIRVRRIAPAAVEHPAHCFLLEMRTFVLYAWSC